MTINHINRPSSSALNNNASKPNEAPPNETSKSSPATSSEDTVSISQETTHIQGLQAQLSNVSDIDMEKVEYIKQEIAKGNYPVDHEGIAQNLISLEKALTD